MGSVFHFHKDELELLTHHHGNGSVLSIDTNSSPAKVGALWRGNYEWNMRVRSTM
jgi:hypothetical protein